MMHYALVARLRVWNTELLHTHLHNNYKPPAAVSAPPPSNSNPDLPPPFARVEGKVKRIWR